MPNRILKDEAYAECLKLADEEEVRTKSAGTMSKSSYADEQDKVKQAIEDMERLARLARLAIAQQAANEADIGL